MKRYFLEFKYAGTAYHGWQIQPNANTVQAEVNKALQTLLGLAVETTGAGRTDTGVHARQMYCHFEAAINEELANKVIYRLNAILPKDIAVVSLFEVDKKSHARFDATERTYEYHITRNKDPFLLERAWFHPFDLNIEAMNEAGKAMKEYTDFKAFSKSRTQVKTNNCSIKEAFWTTEKGHLIFNITADRFLRNMVRAIVGTMIEIGSGDLDLKGFREVVESGDRTKAGLSVPAHGLYLTRIKYPSKTLIA